MDRPTDASPATDRSGDRIEALLRSTGRRPSVPDDRARRVSAHVRAQWIADLRRQARRRWTLTAAAASLAAAVGIPYVVPRSTPDTVRRSGGRVELVADAAWFGTADGTRPTPVRSGDALWVGSDVITDGGRVALVTNSGHSVRLDTGTRIKILGDGAIAFDRGAIYIDSRDGGNAPASRLRIQTPFGTISDLGTQFEVRWISTSLRVQVREGKVVADLHGQTIEAEAGSQIQIGPDGRIDRRATTGRGTPDWIRAITPMPDIDGRRLDEVLAGMARDRGLQLAFDSGETAAAARTIRLSGSVQGMTPDQALESVLATCRMRFSADKTHLRIARADGRTP